VKRRIAVIASAALAALVLCSTGHASAARVENLNHPGKQSYYVFVNKATIARSEPATDAKQVAKVGLHTGDKTDELLLVLASTTDDSGNGWLQVRLPVRPNGTTGWVPAQDMSDLQPVDTWLKINTEAFTATLIKDGKTVFRARVGVGQPQWPTPHGQFYIRDQLKGYGQKGSFYGPLAFATSATSDTLTDWPGGGIVGVHGTSEPHLIPGRISHGCVRLKNADILKLGKLMPVGTPVTIS
jgi:hypothetical protein